MVRCVSWERNTLRGSWKRDQKVSGLQKHACGSVLGQLENTKDDRLFWSFQARWDCGAYPTVYQNPSRSRALRRNPVGHRPPGSWGPGKEEKRGGQGRGAGPEMTTHQRTAAACGHSGHPSLRLKRRALAADHSRRQNTSGKGLLSGQKEL